MKTKHYGSKNKGFAKAHANRRAEKFSRIIKKMSDHRKRGGPAPTKAEREYYDAYMRALYPGMYDQLS